MGKYVLYGEYIYILQKLENIITYTQTRLKEENKVHRCSGNIHNVITSLGNFIDTWVVVTL